MLLRNRSFVLMCTERISWLSSPLIFLHSFPKNIKWPICSNSIYFSGVKQQIAGPSGCAIYDVGLRPLACWDCEFESRWGAWMFVSCECCVLSSRGLRGELITRPEESYRLCSIVGCDIETSRMRGSLPTLGCSDTKKYLRVDHSFLSNALFIHVWSLTLLSHTSPWRSA